MSNLKYIDPCLMYVQKFEREFEELRREFSTYMGFQKAQIHSKGDVVRGICGRIHQRETYYDFFHGNDLVQTKRLGIMAYWVLRYQPLAVRAQSDWKEVYDVNIFFAFYILIASTSSALIHEGFSADKARYLTNQIAGNFKNDFIRSLSEHDISKEAFMLIADSFAFWAKIAASEISK